MVFEEEGSAEMFFKIKAKLTEFHRLFIGIKIGQLTKEEGLEHCRATLVQAVKAGERMCIMIDRIAPDFKEEFNDETLFPTDKIFNFKEFRKMETYKSIITEEEDRDYQDNKGNYLMHEDYTLVILSTARNEEEKQAVIDNLPCLDSFEIIEIVKELP